ncbi:hypothetical protein Cgig2_015363 [Carnegiea gigantea]|uniref:Uncharacterized protein n=1 Tax=Carnegiea gigantea TaxID=171969 RepID=A0A9Q1QE18_9CARY|nr:hypothetical protein Cgig2_015363 [Carnegiea gigantea]
MSLATYIEFSPPLPNNIFPNTTFYGTPIGSQLTITKAPDAPQSKVDFHRLALVVFSQLLTVVLNIIPVSTAVYAVACILTGKEITFRKAIRVIFTNIIWILADVVSVTEKTCGMKALKKSQSLIKGRWELLLESWLWFVHFGCPLNHSCQKFSILYASPITMSLLTSSPGLTTLGSLTGHFSFKHEREGSRGSPSVACTSICYNYGFIFVK